MTRPHDIRQLALQGLFQFDARGDADADAVRVSMGRSAEEMAVEFSTTDVDRAFELAQGAYAKSGDADRLIRELAPTWPASRQPAVDRAILRLAHFEMTTGQTPPKVAVNEAIELAKVFSTERSPAFINGVLDKALKRLRSAEPDAHTAIEASRPEG